MAQAQLFKVTFPQVYIGDNGVAQSTVTTLDNTPFHAGREMLREAINDQTFGDYQIRHEWIPVIVEKVSTGRIRQYRAACNRRGGRYVISDFVSDRG